MTPSIKISTKSLKNALSKVAKAVDVNSNLPILGTILLKTQDGRIVLTATNLELSISSGVALDMIDGEVNVAIPGKTLTDLVGSLSDPNLEIKPGKEDKISFKSGGLTTNLKGLPADEFPLSKPVEPNKVIALDAKAFKEALEKVVYASSSDDARPVLKSVLFEINQNNINLVGTDGYRLATHKIEVDCGFEAKKMIPKATLKEVISSMTKPVGTIEIGIGENQVSFKTQDAIYVTSLIEGNFPPYQSIIPKSKKITVTIDRKKLLSAVKQADVFARGNNHLCRLDIQAGKVMVIGEGDEGKHEGLVEAKVEGPELMIGFNALYLEDTLKETPSDQIMMSFNAHNTPALIQTDGDQDGMVVIMPMHTGG